MTTHKSPRAIAAALLMALLMGASSLAIAPNAQAQTSGDTDGDGVPDTEEMNSYALLVNAGFEDSVDANNATATWGSAPSRAMQFRERDVRGWNTTERRNRIEIWESGYAGAPSQNGNYHAEINANENAALYQDITTQPGTTLEWSIWHRGRSGMDHAVALVGDVNTPLNELPVEVYMATDNKEWARYSGTYVVPAGQTRTRLAFRSMSTATGNLSVGNFIDNLEVNVLVERDTDGDGKPDHQDTDSDNDGTRDGDEDTYVIPDAGFGEGPSCGAVVSSDRLPRQAVNARSWTSPTNVFSSGFDGDQDWVVLSGSWEQREGELRQIRDCGYDYTALLRSPQVTDFTYEVAFRSLDGTRGGGIVFNQSSEKTRSGAMVVDLSNDGRTLRWGSYNEAGYYRFIGSATVTSQGTDVISVTQKGRSVEISFNGTALATTTTSNPGGYVGVMSSLSAVAFEKAVLTALPS